MASEEYEEVEDVVEAVDAEDGREQSREFVAEKARRQLQRSRLARLAEKLTGGPERPGQQKIASSPVVMLLVGTTVGASILAAIFWFINARNQEDRLLTGIRDPNPPGGGVKQHVRGRRVCEKRTHRIRHERLPR